MLISAQRVILWARVLTRHPFEVSSFPNPAYTANPAPAPFSEEVSCSASRKPAPRIGSSLYQRGVRITSQETHRSFGRFLEIHQPMLQSQIQITGWYCKTRNWLGLHPISHSRHNTLSIILRATLTSEMTTSPCRTIQEYNTGIQEYRTIQEYNTAASGEDPSNDRSNAWGSWPVIAGWDRTKWPTYARAVIMPMYTKPKPYYAMSRKYICSAYHRVCFSMQYCSKTSHHDISSDVQSTECHTLVCRINDPAMIIAMIAGPQGTRAEDYAVHMSPQAKLPVRFMSSCPHTNTNNM